MTESVRRASPSGAYGEALVELGARDPRLAVVTSDVAGAAPATAFGQRFPERCFDLGTVGPSLMSVAAGLALDGRTVFASTYAALAAGEGYPVVRDAVCRSGANVKIGAISANVSASPDGGGPLAVEDVGRMRGLPGMMVVVPSDGPSARAATLAVADRPGPAYLRLASDHLPTVTDGTFTLGKAPELRAGSDLTIVAVGALVTRALEVANDLARVGLSTRVLDFASVKPFDEPALLRAARDTGALLVVEEHSVLTGVGALVAATTAENYPVPVRRVGVPDVFEEPGDRSAGPERYGFSSERLRDEAWELLKSRGKVS